MQRLLLITIMLAIGIMATGFGQEPFDYPGILSAEGEQGVLGGIMATGFGQEPFDYPGILLAEGEQGVLGLGGPLPPPPTTQSKGKIEYINPPGNNGSQPGAGLINPKNSTGGLTGPPYHLFQTPADVKVTTPAQDLYEGLDVDYTVTGTQASLVQRDV